MTILSLKGYDNFGWSNGWSKVPDKVRDCKHSWEKHSESSGRCVTTYICDACKYYYKEDSGD